MPMGCANLTSLNDRLHRPDPFWCYLNRSADDQYEPDMRAYRAAYSANRRTLDQLWQAGLVDKYADPDDTRRHYFTATEAGAARIGATRHPMTYPCRVWGCFRSAHTIRTPSALHTQD